LLIHRIRTGKRLKAGTQEGWKGRLRGHNHEFCGKDATGEGGPAELEGLRDRVRELEASEAKVREDAAVLRKEREQFLNFLDGAPYGLLSVAANGVTLYVNRQFYAITGYSIEDVPNVRILLRKAFPNQRYRHELIAKWRTSIGSGTGATFSLVSREGDTREIEFRPTLFEDGRLVVMIFDVTDHKRWEEAISYLAYHDALTDLPNRTLLNDLLSSALDSAKREKKKLGVMLIDLDNFKETNDRYGHSAGDLLLRSIATRVRDLLRVTDTVARVGGDEFIVLLPSIHSSEDIVQIAEKIVRAFEVPLSYQNHPLTITASMGGAIYPEDGDDAETLIVEADRAMYEAKRQADKKYFIPGRS
jgi:diguanylate cyclase (GGDEF)-like protein/PAS domain S-box-containing protein